MKDWISAGAAFAVLAGVPAWAADTGAAGGARAAETPADRGRADADTDDDRDVVVEGHRGATGAGTKTDTPLTEVPQPVSVIAADTYLAQGAIDIADTVRYAAGVNADSYGRDTRSDSFLIRGLEALQFRDGMRDVFSYWATPPADPYNFAQVEVVRGPASVLFGQASIGGVVNLVSKTPGFASRAELGVTAGSYGRKELLADGEALIAQDLGVRLVARARDADSYVAHTADDRVMLAPSLRWRPDARTEVTLLGLFQQDRGGATTNFLPLVGSFRPNRELPRLDPYLFLGKPGWDRYDGRVVQGGGAIVHRFGTAVTLNLKARAIGSDLIYRSHFPDSYSKPQDPYLPGSNGRQIGLYAYGLDKRMNVVSTDDNLQIRFATGAGIEHLLLAGVDYSWNAVRDRFGFATQAIDLYAVDRRQLLTPDATGPYVRTAQRQLGVYVQDQLRIRHRVSVVLGARRDRVTTTTSNPGAIAASKVDTATTFRAGIIGEVGAGLSPFFSYTESFLPVTGRTASGAPFRPQAGHQFETGLKWQANAVTLVTLTGFHMVDSNRPIPDPANPREQIQTGRVTSRGVELEATRTLANDYEFSLGYGYQHVAGGGMTDFNARHVASGWASRRWVLGTATVRLGAGVRYIGRQTSSNAAWTIVTPGRTQADALAELDHGTWRLRLNATNLLDDRAYAYCLARGDCFASAPRNVMLSATYRF